MNCGPGGGVGLKFLKVMRAVFARRDRSAVLPSAAVRNFLFRVEAEGGFLFENDPLFVEWGDEAREASRLGLFVSEGGFAVGSRLTHKGERVLRAFREHGAAAFAVTGTAGTMPIGTVLARKSGRDI
jgi:hypothetical protein